MDGLGVDEPAGQGQADGFGDPEPVHCGVAQRLAAGWEHVGTDDRGFVTVRAPDGFVETVHSRTGETTGPDGYDKDGWKTVFSHHVPSEGRQDGLEPAGRVHRETGTAFDPDGFDHRGLDADGFGREGFDLRGYDRSGVHREGHDRRGFAPDGTHRVTGTARDEFGYDREGVTEDGWTREGAHAGTGTSFGPDGYDVSGFDAEKFGRDGHNRRGWDRQGVHKDTGGRFAPPDRDGVRWTQETHDAEGGFSYREGIDADGTEVHEAVANLEVDAGGTTEHLTAELTVRDAGTAAGAKRVAAEAYVSGPGYSYGEWSADGLVLPPGRTVREAVPGILGDVEEWARATDPHPDTP